MTNIITTAISEIGTQGDGLGVHGGETLYVPKTAPGDIVQVRPEGKDYARLVSIQTPSPDRVEPPCPHFQKCGGCSLQHVTQQFYTDWKMDRVRSSLERAGVKVKTWNDPIFLPAATRRRTSLAARRNGDKITLGYNPVRSHDILDIKTCLILKPELEAKVQGLRPFLTRLLPDGKTVDITLQHADGLTDMVLTGHFPPSLDRDETLGELAELLDIARISLRARDFGPVETLLTRKSVTKRFGSISVNLPPAAFLQASDEGEAALTAFVVEHAKGATKVADLFSGCGTFAGHLLKAGHQVSAFDGDGAAIKALGRPALKTEQRDLFKNPLSEVELDAFEIVVFDPPRAGAKEQSERLAYSDVPKIIGISCNPGTFARDAALLQEGGYSLQSVTLIDQFTWSAHTEIASVFVKK